MNLYVKSGQAITPAQSGTFADDLSLLADVMRSITTLTRLRNVEKKIDKVIERIDSAHAINRLLSSNLQKLLGRDVVTGDYVDADEIGRAHV